MAGKEGAQGRARAHLLLTGVELQVTESLCFTKGTASATEGKWSSAGKDLLPCQHPHHLARRQGDRPLLRSPAWDPLDSAQRSSPSKTADPRDGAPAAQLLSVGSVCVCAHV